MFMSYKRVRCGETLPHENGFTDTSYTGRTHSVCRINVQWVEPISKMKRKKVKGINPDPGWILNITIK